MKFLIAVGSRTYSEPTLRVGMQIAKAFQASATIVYVGEKISKYMVGHIQLAHERLEEWDFKRPGVEVLEWAFHFLAENGYITPLTIETGFRQNKLVDQGTRAELYLQGTVCSEVNLILRNGDIISELREEVAREHYDVTIIGGSQKRRMGHDLIQFIGSSIFVVNNFQPDEKYRLLIAVDDSPGTNKAIKFGARIAHELGMEVTLLTVSKKDYFGKGYRGAANRAAKFMRRAGVTHENLFKVGDPATVIKATAGKNSIIVMGASRKHPLAKFFTGSKPLKVMEDCYCPVLIVK
jgi:nucleotide-binding universal stress UspA family protein